MAFVQAAHQVRDQIASQSMMVRHRSSRAPLAAVRTGLSLAALSLMVAYGLSLSTTTAIARRKTRDR